MFKKYRECKNSVTKANLLKEYKILKNNLVSETRQSKKDYYAKYFTEHKDNLQKTWQGIKEVINIKSKSYIQPTCVIDENKATVINPPKIAHTFN